MKEIQGRESPTLAHNVIEAAANQLPPPP